MSGLKVILRPGLRVKSNKRAIFGVTRIGVAPRLNNERSLSFCLEINLIKIHVERIAISWSGLTGINNLVTVWCPIKGSHMPICQGNELGLPALDRDYVEPAELIVLVSDDRIIASLPSFQFF